MDRALPSSDASYLQALPLANLALMAARMQDYIAAFAEFPIGGVCKSSTRILRAMTRLMGIMKIARQHNHDIKMRAHLEHDARFSADVFKSLGGEPAARAWELRYYKAQNAAGFEPQPLRITAHKARCHAIPRKAIKTDDSGMFRWAVIKRPHQYSLSGHRPQSARTSRDMKAVKLIELRPDQLRPDERRSGELCPSAPAPKRPYPHSAPDIISEPKESDAIVIPYVAPD